MPRPKNPDAPPGWHSRGYLPHFDGGEIPQFITLRLADSMPQEFLHSLKSYTANEANKLLQRSGQFWQIESFERWVRDANHFAKVIAYIENNPVKARLCKKPEDWTFSSAWFRKRGVKK